jgi:hypothetical protein
MRHLFIPDTQVKEGVPLKHLHALGKYIVDKKPEVIVMIGDFWDMPSLSSYDVGKKSYEGRRYVKDIEAGIRGMHTLLCPLWEYNAKRKRDKKKLYKPRLVFCLGNHEQRIIRAAETDPKLEGLIGYHDLKLEEMGWEVHNFMDIVEIDGIHYSHYFVNPDSLAKRPIGGTMDNKLKGLGFSFSMGHQQTLQYGIRHRTNGEAIQGLVAGAFYAHDEEYMGVQGNKHWRGVIMKNNVENGTYDPNFVSIDYLMKRYA